VLVVVMEVKFFLHDQTFYQQLEKILVLVESQLCVGEVQV
jgi:hypothetical protein